MNTITHVGISSLPPFSADAAVMSIEGDERNISASFRIQYTNLSEKDVAAVQNGKIRIGHVRVACRGGAFPLFLFRFRTLVFDAPFSLGLETSDSRGRLARTLSRSHELNHATTWPLMIEATERTTHLIRARRVITPSPRFWQGVANSLQDSANVTRETQADTLQRLNARYPAPSKLFRRARNIETF